MSNDNKNPVAAWIGAIPNQWSNQESISVKITGPVHTGKTLLGVTILKALEQAGYKDVGFTDHESTYEILSSRYESLETEAPNPHVFTRPIRIEEIHQRFPAPQVWSEETIAKAEAALAIMKKASAEADGILPGIGKLEAELEELIQYFKVHRR